MANLDGGEVLLAQFFELVEDLKSILFTNPGDVSLAWLKVLMVSLPGAVVLLLTVALVGVEDHVPLHGLGPFSLEWIVFLVYFFFQICS